MNSFTRQRISKTLFLISIKPEKDRIFSTFKTRPQLLKRKFKNKLTRSNKRAIGPEIQSKNSLVFSFPQFSPPPP
jgi:hypothetical protein